MENHFKLAHEWGCVLLLDEVDVFLAKRDVCLCALMRLRYTVTDFEVRVVKRCLEEQTGFR